MCPDLRMFLLQIKDVVVKTLRLLITHWLKCQMTAKPLPWLTAFSPNWISFSNYRELKLLFWWEQSRRTKVRLTSCQRGEGAKSSGASPLPPDWLFSTKTAGSLTFNESTSSLCEVCCCVCLTTNNNNKETQTIWLFLPEWCQTLTCTQRQQKKLTDGVDFGRKGELYSKGKCIKYI